MKNKSNKKNIEKESGFKIINILLLESNFKREPIVTSNNKDLKVNINVGLSINVNEKENEVIVVEKVEYTQTFKEKEEVKCTIVMVGKFEKVGNENLDLRAFGKINGAAIIFPYIREHLSNLSAKAGLELIILPPYNFVKLHKDV